MLKNPFTSVKSPVPMRRFTQRYKVFDHKIQHADIVLTEEMLNSLSQKISTKYEFEGVIARGGMKTIIRLRDKDTARNVAMAMLINQDADLVSIGRFIREARITANLEHPNIIPIHEIGVDGQSPYFIMKLIEGETLLDIIENLRAGNKIYTDHYTLTRLVRIFRQVVNAIVFAHARGVIHLDLSPGNILVGKFGEVLVLDWGLAQVIEHNPEDSVNDSLIADIRNRLLNTPNASIEEGIAQGTPGYMSPEQASGEHSNIDTRSDIYALGAILYTILTLSPSITGVSVHEILRETIEGRILPPCKKVKKHIPNSLNALVMKAMQKDPNKRYQTVTQVKDDLDAYVEGRATMAENASILRHLVLFIKRHTYAVVFATLLSLTIIGYISYTFLSEYAGVFHWSAPIYKIDLRTQIYSAASQLNFTDSSNSNSSPFIFNSNGYEIPPHQAIWLPTPLPYFDAQAFFSIYTTKPEFDLYFGAINEPLKDTTFSPQGFIVSFINNTIQISYLSRQSKLLPFITIPYHTETTKKPEEYTVLIQSMNNIIRIYVNNINVLHFENPFPTVPRMPSIGIRAGKNPLTLSGAQLKQAKPDGTLGIFVIPEMLTTRNRLNEAIDYYLQIASTCKSARTAHFAVLRALSLITFRDADIEEKKINLSKINAFIENDKYAELRPFHHMAKADLLWQKSQFKETIQSIELIKSPIYRGYISAYLLNYNYPAPKSIIDKLKSYSIKR